MDEGQSKRVLHLTDLHLLRASDGRAYGAEPLSALGAVIEAALAEGPPLDAIVITGDLSDDATEASYELLRLTLEATGLPTCVVPGNHDSPQVMRDVLGDSVSMGPVQDLGSWRLLLLDSAVAGHAHGTLATAQLDLVRALADADAATHVMACFHHSVPRYCPASGCQLWNADDFVRIAAEYPSIRAVISGHLHVELEAVVGGVTCLTTPSTCVQGRHPAHDASVDVDDFWASHEFDPTRGGYRILDLHADGTLGSRVGWVSLATS